MLVFKYQKHLNFVKVLISVENIKKHEETKGDNFKRKRETWNWELLLEWGYYSTFRKTLESRDAEGIELQVKSASDWSQVWKVTGQQETLTTGPTVEVQKNQPWSMFHSWTLPKEQRPREEETQVLGRQKSVPKWLNCWICL